MGLFLACGFPGAGARSSAQEKPPVSSAEKDAGATGEKAGTASSTDGAPSQLRTLKPSMDSPPFPASDWSYGGSSTIGAPDGLSYPLMRGLGMTEGRTHVYGWISASVNASTSHDTDYPVSYIAIPNRVELNQATIHLERLPDTVQKDHFDWGYHLMGLLGTDYRFTIAEGYGIRQLYKKNRDYGFDPMLMYADFYLPLKDGLNIRVGRFMALPGIESQPALNNYTITHSLAYTAAPSTDTGIVGSLKLNKQWMVQLGVTAGHDTAPWVADRTPGLLACISHSAATNHDNVYLCASGINDGRYSHDNVQHYDATWYHRFNAKWHMATEAWYMYQREVPNVAGNVTNPSEPLAGTSGASCAAGQLTCTAPAYAFLNYINREINSKLYFGFRSDVLNDKRGQRTGFAGKYTENSIYATRYFGSSIIVRPELRFDHSWDRDGYNNGKAKNQFFAGVDLIYKF